MPAIIKAPRCTVIETFKKLRTRTLLMIRSEHRLGLGRRYRTAAELILIERGIALGEISQSRQEA